MKKIHRVTRGDDFAILIPLFVDGMRIPVDGWSFTFIVKLSKDDADDDAIVKLTTADGNVLPHGACSVRAEGARADTQGKPVGKYVWAIRGTSPTGLTRTLEEGPFILEQEPIIDP